MKEQIEQQSAYCAEVQHELQLQKAAFIEYKKNEETRKRKMEQELNQITKKMREMERTSSKTPSTAKKDEFQQPQVTRELTTRTEKKLTDLESQQQNTSELLAVTAETQSLMNTRVTNMAQTITQTVEVQGQMFGAQAQMMATQNQVVERQNNLEQVSHDNVDDGCTNSKESSKVIMLQLYRISVNINV